MVDRDALLVASGFKGKGGHEMANLEYWLIRIEEDLPRAGWALRRVGEAIGLTRLSRR